MATWEEEGERNLSASKVALVVNLPSRKRDTNILEGKCKRKAELVELAFNAYSVKLAKVSEGESENENLIMAELLATDEGVLADPLSILKSNWSRNLSLFPEVTFPDICNYLLGKTDKYSKENLKVF